MQEKEPMNVGKLIAELSKWDHNIPIYVGDWDHHEYDAVYVLVDDESGLLMITPTDN